MNPSPAPHSRLTPATCALARRVDVEAIAAMVSEAVVAEAFTEHSGDPVFRAALDRSVRDNVGAILALWSGTGTLTDIRPPAAFALTDMLAELGVPISEVERSYWVGMSRAWQEWFALARAAADAGEGTVEEFVGPPTELLFKYLIDVVTMVVERYDTVSEAIRRSRDDTRRELVGELVDGTRTESSEDLERALGYRLSGTHLALAVHIGGRREAERLTADLVGAVAARGSLLIVAGPGMWLVWLGLNAAPGAAAWTAIETVARARGAAVFAGEADSGPAGFLQTRRDALDAARLRRWLDPVPALVRFREVRLELMLSNDERAARRFIVEELGALAGSGDRVERARDTLLDWLITGSASRTAERMGVHENTIRARLAHAEELLPQDVRTHRAEVMAALRLRVMVGESPI